MTKSTPVIFQRTLLAAAILSLSACSSLPTAPEVGNGVVNAGKATANITRKGWNKTTYLLGFTDAEDGEAASPSDEQLLTAENDSDNQLLPLAETPTIETPSASDAPAIDIASADRPVLLEQGTAGIVQSPAAQDAQIVTAEDQFQTEDFIHEVSSSETLWDIAKATTGDANNWHVLADVNNLTQDATVFPGQQLVIPADMLKPDFDVPVADAESSDIAVAALNLDSDLGDTTPASSSPQLETPTQRGESIDVDALVDADSQVIDKAAQLASLSQDASAFDLNVGETLWDFAKRTTGDATNWQSIATHNNFTEKQAVTVRPGQTIFVPQALLRDDQQGNAMTPSTTSEATQSASGLVDSVKSDIAVASSSATNKLETASEQVLAAAQPAPEELTQEVALAADESQPLKIVEATYKADDLLNAENVADKSVQVVESDNIPSLITVSGTYYPKAVYNTADFSSSLLTRVSPGTELQVSSAAGTWYKVETKQGVGYVHQRDVK